MGNYKELIFGAKLKADTPNTVIATLQYMINGKDAPENIVFDQGLFSAGSFSFPVSTVQNDFFHDGDNWILSHRGNYKQNDDNGFIENLLAWIKPFIESGSGTKDIYAIMIGEDSSEATVYSLAG